MKDAPVIDRETIEMLREMDALTEDDNLLVELIDEFLSHSHGLIVAIKKNSHHQVFDELATHSHSLKGASLNIGALSLFKICDTLETMARRQELLDIDNLLTSLDLAYQQTAVALTEIRNRASRDEPIDDLLG
ncbi:MAG: Hpt domain-containing protein [Caldilineaceae bacterium]